MHLIGTKCCDEDMEMVACFNLNMGLVQKNNYVLSTAKPHSYTIKKCSKVAYVN